MPAHNIIFSGQFFLLLLYCSLCSFADSAQLPAASSRTGGTEFLETPITKTGAVEVVSSASQSSQQKNARLTADMAAVEDVTPVSNVAKDNTQTENAAKGNVAGSADANLLTTDSVACDESAQNCSIAFNKTRVPFALLDWKPLRIAAYAVDLNNTVGTSACPPSSSSSSSTQTSSSCLKDTRFNVTKRILSGIMGMVPKGILTRRIELSGVEPKFRQLGVCTRLNNSSYYKNDTMKNADVTLYVTLKNAGRNQRTAFVEPCVTVSDRILAIAVNVNPQNISELDSIIPGLVLNISNLLGISQCPKSDALLFHGKGVNDTLHTSCASVKCDTNEEKVSFQYKNQSQTQTEWKTCITKKGLTPFNTSGFVSCPIYSDVCQSAFSIAAKEYMQTVLKNEHTGEHTAQDPLPMVCPKASEVCTTDSSGATKLQFSSTWKRMTVGLSLSELYDPFMYCPFGCNDIQFIRKDMRGYEITCAFDSEDKNDTNTLSVRKRNMLINEILPDVMKTFSNAPYVRGQSNDASKTSFIFNPLCASFDVENKSLLSASHDSDVVLYVAARPMRAGERNVTVWAESCATIDGRVTAVAVNFNPAKITDKENTIRLAKEEISKAIGIADCPGGDAVLLHKNVSHGYPHSVCAKLHCESASAVKMQYEANSSIWLTCSDDIDQVNTSLYVSDDIHNVKRFDNFTQARLWEANQVQLISPKDSTPNDDVPFIVFPHVSPFVRLMQIIQTGNTLHSLKEKAVLLNDKRPGGERYSMCVLVDCDDTADKMTLRVNDSIVSAKCNTKNENVSLLGGNLSITCPPYESVCKKREREPNDIPPQTHESKEPESQEAVETNKEKQEHEPHVIPLKTHESKEPESREFVGTSTETQHDHTLNNATGSHNDVEEKQVDESSSAREQSETSKAQKDMKKNAVDNEVHRPLAVGVNDGSIGVSRLSVAGLFTLYLLAGLLF